MLAISSNDTSTAGSLAVSLDIYADIQITRYVKIVCAMMILYDYVITLGQEVDLIWMEKWSKVKIIFLLNRYYALAAIFIDSTVMYANGINYEASFLGKATLTLFRSGAIAITGSHYYYWATYSCLILAILSQVILQLRVQALYSGSKLILALMVACFVGCSVGAAWILWTNLRGIQFIKILVPSHTTFCIPTRIANFYSVWIPLLVFEVLLCVLAFCRGFRKIHVHDPFLTRRRTLFNVLIRDSMIYFVVIAIVYLIALLFWILAPPGLLQGPSGFPAAFSSILSNRAILNLRQVAQEGSEIEMDTREFSLILRSQLREVGVKDDSEALM